jgi:hypothetical protein
MEEDEIGRMVVESAVPVHRKIGPGLLETVYEVILVHELLTYLRLADKRLGYLLNFSGFLMKNGITRVANHLFE